MVLNYIALLNPFLWMMAMWMSKVMAHGWGTNIFGAFVGETAIRGIYFEMGFGMSAGNKSGSLPAISATYEGVMLGVDSSGANRGEHLEGNARLEFRASVGDARMDVSFHEHQGQKRGRELRGYRMAQPKGRG